MKTEIDGVQVELTDADALAVLESRVKLLTERIETLEQKVKRWIEYGERTRERLRKLESGARPATPLSKPLIEQTTSWGVAGQSGPEPLKSAD
jgi:hypothetical protein